MPVSVHSVDNVEIPPAPKPNLSWILRGSLPFNYLTPLCHAAFPYQQEYARYLCPQPHHCPFAVHRRGHTCKYDLSIGEYPELLSRSTAKHYRKIKGRSSPLSSSDAECSLQIPPQSTR
jgi:hypothetical protein